MGSLETWRDFVIVVYGIMGILLFFLLIAATIIVILGLRKLMKTVDETLKDPIRPALADLREGASSVRSATEFWADNAVSPLIKVMAAGRGLKRGVSSFSRIARKVKR